MPTSRRWEVPRAAALVVVLLVVLGLLQLTQAPAVDPAAVLVVVVAAVVLGRVMPRLRLPAVVGWLAVGTLAGPGMGAVVASWVAAWPYAGGLVTGAELVTAEPLRRLAVGLVAVWIGRQLDPRALEGGLRALVGLFTGYAVVVPLLTALAGWAVLSGRLVTDAAAIVDEPGDVAGFMVSLLGTSPLLVAAVLRSQRAEGPVSRTMLWLAVLGELLALALLAGWAAQTGSWTGLRLDHPGDPGTLGATLAVGLVGGGLMAAGTRWAPTARGPWVLAVAVALIWSVARVGLSVPLVGLVAGFGLALFAPSSTSVALRLAADVGLPVVFVLGGASVPLARLVDVLPEASLLAVVRSGVLFGAAIGAGRLMGGRPGVVRYAWTGLFASTIPLAGVLPWRAVSRTDVLSQGTASVWALAAINGLVGAVAMHLAVRAARETPDTREVGGGAVSDDPWAHAEDVLPEGPLRRDVGLLAEDLRALVRDLRHDMLRDFTDQTQAYLDHLRREFRRHHRRAAALLQGDRDDLAEGLSVVRVELVERWRSYVVEHAARMNRQPWTPELLVEALDRIAQHVPETVPVPPETRGSGLQESFRAFTGWLVGAGPQRRLPYRRVVGGHLTARGPLAMEPVATVVVNAEIHLAARTRELLYRVLEDHGGLLEGAGDAAQLERIQDDVTSDFAAARGEIEGFVDDACQRLEAVLGRMLAEITDELLAVARLERAPDATSSREAGMDMVKERYRRARRAAQVQFEALALEMELSALEIEVRGALAEHGEHLARLVRGRGTTQLERVHEALDATMARVDEVLGGDAPAGEVADALREAAEGFSRLTTDAVATADELRRELAGEQALAPLVDALVDASTRLTDHHEVPHGTTTHGSWSLPVPPETVEVPFREVVLDYIETSVTHDLLDLTQRYAARLEKCTDAMEGVEQSVAFNVELAVAELVVAADLPVSRQQATTVREIVHEGLERGRDDVVRLLGDATGWYDEVEQRIEAAVMDDLDALRVRVADGRFPEIAAERARHRAERTAGPDAAERVAGWLDQARARVGVQGMARLRRFLGVHAPAEGELTPERFAPPAPRTEIPLVYRRLFSEQALEAGELLGGRAGRADDVREALEQAADPRLRTVAVVGPAGAGQRATIRAALRAMRVRGVKRHDLEGPVTLADVDGWFETGAADTVHVVTGLHWLYTLRPGGLDPLLRFVDGVLADGGRNAWVVEADDAVWRFATVAAPLGRAFPTVVGIQPLDVDALREAMLGRHAMSDLELVFDGAGTGRARDRYVDAWFRDFHAASGGIARDAMQLWLAAVDQVDLPRRRVVMGGVPDVPTRAMRHVSDRSALALLVAARQGYVDEATCVRLFRDDALYARAELAHLVHWGLLQPDGDRYVLPAHLRRSLAHLAARRGLA